MAETANIMLPGAPNYPVPGVTGTGAIKGGLLRPGSIDQSRFQQLLQAQTQAEAATEAMPKGLTLDDYRKLAGAPVSARTAAPTAAPAPAPTDGIPTLSAEQFAVLTGISVPETAQGTQFPAGDSGQIPSAAPAEPTSPAAPPIAAPLPTTPGVTVGAPFEMVPPEIATQTASVEDVLAPESGADGVPVTDSATELAPIEVEATAEAEDPRVVWFDSMPDREERRMLEASGQKWRLRETPGARELFLGPDGKFGWDDALDIINPLQHIPVVAQIYRAVTGDQAYGLSQFMGAVPFGPISIASAVIDTVVRSETGRDAGTDIAAAVLGIDNRTPEEANLHLAQPAGQDLAVSPASGDDILAEAVVPDPAWMREDQIGGAG
ncbi:hypothetical protein [Dongia sp.]|uniref:hypothetical protein n=1 Tax=Dongia sp. TaxID=1977262 RepID=UPI0035B2B8A7